MECCSRIPGEQIDEFCYICRHFNHGIVHFCATLNGDTGQQRLLCEANMSNVIIHDSTSILESCLEFDNDLIGE